MKIKNISITDYKGIVETLELDFTGKNGEPLDLIVLAGPNGCGKTSVIESCSLGFIYVHQYDFPILKPNSVRRGKDNCVIQATLINGKELFKTTHKIMRHLEGDRETVSHSASSSDTEECIKHMRSIQVVFFTSWRGPKLPEGVVLNPIGNDLPKTEENRLYHIVSDIVNKVAERGFPDYDPTKPDEASIILEKIINGWRIFYPEKPLDRFEARKSGEKKFNVFLNKSSSNESIPVDSLSSGELEIFIMLGWFAVNDFDGGIVLIDEPELHLHPAWQRKILPALQKVMPDTQIIAATHSPLILSSVPPECIRLLEHPDNILLQKDEKRSADIPYASYGLDSNRILEDIMDVDERPEEIKNKFDDMFLAIDKNELNRAENILRELKDKILDDPQLLKAEILIKRKVTIGK